MTRETRIGLLIGLGFIIMFGLVLSEFTGTSGPQSTLARPEKEPIDSGWVESIKPEQIPQLVEIAPVAVELSSVVGQVDDTASLVPTAGPQEAAGDGLQVEERPILSANIVRTLDPAPALHLPKTEPQLSSLAPTRTYTVQPNDSLIKIARKVYGDRHSREYGRIFDANRDKLPDESTLVIGQVLKVPPLEEPTRQERNAGLQQARTTAARRAVQKATLEELPSVLSEMATSNSQNSSRRIYVVRPGDNLTKIARRMLNDDGPASVRRIYDANRHKLQSPNLLPVGARLEIPSEG